jgi:hypothetical protein
MKKTLLSKLFPQNSWRCWLSSRNMVGWSPFILLVTLPSVFPFSLSLPMSLYLCLSLCPPICLLSLWIVMLHHFKLFNILHRLDMAFWGTFIEKFTYYIIQPFIGFCNNQYSHFKTPL